MTNPPTPLQLAKMDALAEKIITELRTEAGAEERLRIFAAHGDSSNFDQDDAKAIMRVIASGPRDRAEAANLRAAVTQAIDDLTPEKDWTWPALEEARQAALASLRRALDG